MGICIWKMEADSFECVATLEGHEDEEFECASVISSHTQDVKAVIWHPDAEVLASASYDDSIKLYEDDGDDWTCTNTLESRDSTVWCIDFDKTASRLASGSDDKTVKIWKKYLPGNEEGIATPDNKPAWKNVCTLSGYHSRPIYDLKWCKK